MQLIKRRLSDLWVVGRLVEVDDGNGDPFNVWVQKLNSLEAQETNRRCDAARARVLLTRDEDSDAWVAANGTVHEYIDGDKKRAAEFLSGEERGKLNRKWEQRLANEEEWSKDGRIQALRDAWNDTLETRWLKDKDDPEAAACKEALDLFLAQLNEGVDSEMNAVLDGLMANSLGELEHRMTMKMLDMEGNNAWTREMYCCQIYYGTRDPDAKLNKVFDSRSEVDELSEKAWQFLHNVYQNLEVDVMEGKVSEAAPASSTLSVVPNEEPTVTDSGPVGANA